MRVSPLFLAAIASTSLLLGCGPKADPALAAATRQAFNSAPPELKQDWDRVLEADRTNGYVFAQRMLYELSQRPLAPEQAAAVSNLNGSISKRLYNAAERGDAAALNAIRELRRNPPNR